MVVQRSMSKIITFPFKVTPITLTSDRFLSGADLAKRLGVNPTTLSKNRTKPNFAQWSQEKDPEQRLGSMYQRWSSIRRCCLHLSTEILFAVSWQYHWGNNQPERRVRGSQA